jgi:AAA+ ATPase superfamily predicted ATPase
MKLVGRKAEIAALNGYENSGEPEFVVVYGRRRVGKTFLIREYFKETFFFYVTGVSSVEMTDQEKTLGETLKKLNLNRFDKALAEYGKELL